MDKQCVKVERESFVKCIEGLRATADAIKRTKEEHAPTANNLQGGRDRGRCR